MSACLDEVYERDDGVGWEENEGGVCQVPLHPFQGFIKFLIPPGPWRAVYQVCCGKISSCEEGKWISWQLWEENTWKKGKQYHLPYNIKAVGKNIKWGRRRKFGEESENLKNVGGEEYRVIGNYIHPWRAVFNKSLFSFNWRYVAGISWSECQRNDRPSCSPLPGPKR